MSPRGTGQCERLACRGEGGETSFERAAFGTRADREWGCLAAGSGLGALETHTWRPPACGVARGRAGVLGGQRAPQPAASSRPTAVGTVTVCRSPSSRLCRYHLSPPDIRRGAACCRPPGEPAKAPHAPPSETAGPASGRPASGLGRPL